MILWRRIEESMNDYIPVGKPYWAKDAPAAARKAFRYFIYSSKHWFEQSRNVFMVLFCQSEWETSIVAENISVFAIIFIFFKYIARVNYYFQIIDYCLLTYCCIGRLDKAASTITVEEVETGELYRFCEIELHCDKQSHRPRQSKKDEQMLHLQLDC